MDFTSNPFLKPLANFPPYPTDETASWTGPNFVAQDDGRWGTYVHLVVLGALAAFAMAWAIGANDVANAFATSVGAKTLKLWQACVIAAIFEFVGAITLGGQVAKTIAGSITSPEYFRTAPEIFAFGMLCALISAATIVTVATYFHAAVSTTHSIIGAVLGFGLVYGGADSIVWNRKTNEFPFRTGVVTVFMSWVIAPISTAILGAIIFFLVRAIVLRRQNSTEWAFWTLPVLAFVTVYVNIFFVLYKGAGKDLKGQVGALYWDKAGNTAGWVSAVAAAGAALLCIPAVFWLKRKHAARMSNAESVAVAAAAAQGDMSKMENGKTDLNADGTHKVSNNIFSRAMAKLHHSLTVDVHEDVHKHEAVAAIHANAEVFNPYTEEVFKYLQVFSACCVSFAHGSNDVANAIGPFAGIWYVYTTRNVSSEAETPRWILVIGGAGLVIGLATYGYNIIKVLGVGLAKMTPSRGFSAELATGLIIALASVYGLPISTTQCIVGAEIGVGIVEGGRRLNGVNWKLLAKTFLGWVIAFVAAAFFSAAIFSFSVFAPSVNDLDYVNNYQNAMTSAMTAELNIMNSTNEYRQAAVPANYDQALEQQLSYLGNAVTGMQNLKKNGKVNLYDMLYTFKQVTGLYLTETIPTYNTTV